MKTVRVNFGTTRPPLVYKYENGDWQSSNVFVVEDGLGTYTFQSRDSFGCIAEITLSESELDFDPGTSVLIISKTLTGGEPADDDVYFKFDVTGPVSFSNILVSVNDPVTLEGLPAGEYTISESTPPTGFLNTDSSKIVDLLDGQIAGVSFVNEKDTETVPTGSGQITINKIVTNEEVSDGDVIFTANLIGPIVKYGIEFSINTPAVITDLPNGTYSIEEVGLPSGYFLNAVSPSSVIITDSSLTHTVSVINTVGAENVGPGKITFEKQIYEDDGTGTLIRISTSDDVLFQSDLIGPLSINNLQFSANSKLVIENLPLGNYTASPDNNVIGYYNFQLSPSIITLTSVNLESTFIFYNEFGTAPPEFDDDIIYYINNITNTEHDLVKSRFSYVLNGGLVELNSVTIPSNAESGITEFNETFLTNNSVNVRRDRKLIVFANAILSSRRHNLLLLYDENFTLIKTVREANSSNISIFKPGLDTENNTYTISGGSSSVLIKKYDANLDLVWTANSPITSTLGWGIYCTKNYVVAYQRTTSPGNVGNLVLFDYDGNYIRTVSDALFYDTTGTQPAFLFNFINGDVGCLVSNISMTIFDEEFNVKHQKIQGVDYNYSSGAWKAGANLDGTFVAQKADNIYHFDEELNELFSAELESETILRGFGWVNNPDIIISFHESGTGFDGVLYDKSDDSLLDIFSSGTNTGDGFPGMLAENWQLLKGQPVPPTGTNTVTINKTITNGLVADDDETFNITIIGPSTRVGLTVSVNSPLTVDDLPDGTYTVQETGTGPSFLLTSITPQTFTVNASNPSQTVEIINDKLSEEFASGTLEVTDVATSTETAEPADVDIEITKAPTKSGSVEIRDADNPSSLVLVEFDSGDTEQDIAGRLVEAINGITTDPKVIDTDMVTPVTGTTAGAGDVVRITSDLPGVLGNSISFIVTFSSDIEIDFQSGGQFTTNMTGGKDGPTRTIYLEYPWRGAVGLSPNIQFDFSDTDDEEAVAQLIVDRVNLSTMELTATRSGAIVTLTEDRAGPIYAGDTFKVILYTSLVGLNPSNGEVVLSIT
jgi:hypothetical protein